MKEETKKTKKFNKKYLAFGILGIFALALVSAAVLTHFAQMQVDVEVTEAITTTGGECTFSTIAGGDYKLCLMDITNNLDKEVNVDITLKVQKWDGTEYVNLTNDDGLLVGLTEDVSYCFKSMGDMVYPEGNVMTEITDCATQFEDWMLQNADWLDWEVLTQAYPGEYDISIVEGTGLTNVVDLTTGELTITGEVIPANLNFQPVLYVDSSVALVPGDYRVIFEIVPSTV